MARVDWAFCVILETLDIMTALVLGMLVCLALAIAVVLLVAIRPDVRDGMC